MGANWTLENMGRLKHEINVGLLWLLDWHGLAGWQACLHASLGGNPPREAQKQRKHVNFIKMALEIEIEFALVH